jgi:hypothetical protein
MPEQYSTVGVDAPADAEPPAADPSEFRPKRRRRTALALAISLPVLVAGGVAAFLLLPGIFAEPEPPTLTAVQVDRIGQEIDEREQLLTDLASHRADYREQLARWGSAVKAAEAHRAASTQPTPSVPNPGGGAMPGNDPDGRVFLDSIGATDVGVLFEAGPENCGYSGAGGDGLVWSGGCVRGEYPNTLFMAWDPGAEPLVWSIFVHEAMHWFQNEKYIEIVFVAESAAIDHALWDAQWEADASCRAVAVYGVPIEDYADSSSPCTVDGWYEGWIVDHMASLGATWGPPDPATFELAESSRP